MKVRSGLGIVLAMLPTAAFAQTVAPQILCFESAVNDADILAELKTQDSPDNANSPGTDFDYETELCSGTSDAQAPLNCYRALMQPDSIIADIIQQNAEADLAFMTDTYAVGLCHKQVSTDVPQDCVQAVQSDPDVLTSMKSMNNPPDVLASWYAALCRGSNDTAARIDCYKQGMSDDSFLSAIKEHNSAEPEFIQFTEESVVGICGDATPF